jgi:hypothetical protein
MPMVRGQWSFLLAPGLNFYTFGRYRERPEMFPRIVNVKTSTRAYEESGGVYGLGPLAPKAELEPVTFDEPGRLGLQRWVHETFALAIAFSKELRDDDQYGFVTQVAGELGKSARYTAELYGHDVYNNGFSTSKYVGRDGKALFATDHPVAGVAGSTIANKPVTDLDLSQAALEAAIASFETQVNERGMPIEVRPRYLLIHPSNRLNASRLLESELQPGGATNDINVLRGEGITPIVDVFLTDPDAWFLIGEPSELGITFYWRERFDTKTWDDNNTDAVMHRGRQRHSVGFDEWRGTYGSSGG